MAHLLKSDVCGYCQQDIVGRKYYIHIPALCAFYHNDVADQVRKNSDTNLAKGIIETTVGGGALAVGAGRLATVGKVGAVTGKVIGGALSVVGGVVSVIEIVDAATEKPPELSACKRCGKPEIENPGCTLVCGRCGVECNSWKDADAKNHCLQVCSGCYNLEKCMKCMKTQGTRKLHTSPSKITVHRSLSTRMYGTCKDARITGSSLTLAGTAVCFIPVVGWALGPALIAGGVGTSIGASVAAKPIVKIHCGHCSKEEEQDTFFGSGCEEWCATCGVKSSDTSKCCLVLCDSCEQTD